MTTDDRLENLVRDHARRAYGLALALTGQSSDADDLVQRAVLVAARKRALIPLEGAWPWFARVLTLEARNLRRARRPAAQPEEVMRVEDHGNSDPARLVLDRELAQALGRELEALPDHEREAVALIHVSGLSYREASAALALSPSTLSQRVKAALDRLRKRLGMDEAALCATLGLLGRTPPPGGLETAITRWLTATKTTAGVGLASAIGGLIVSKKLIVVTALALALVAAGYGLIETGYREEGLDGARGGSEAATAPPVAPRRNADDPEPGETADSRPAEAALTVYGRIRGRVSDSEGRPRGAVRVRLEPVDRELGIEGVEVLTDAEGRYELAPRLPEEDLPATLSFALSASDAELAGSRRNGLWLERGLVLEGLDLLVYRPAALSGRLVDLATGAPVAGAEISVGDVADPARAPIRAASRTPRAVSDAEGRFQLPALAPGRFLPIVTRSGEDGREHDLPVVDMEDIALAEGERRDDVELRVSTARLVFRLTDDPGGSVQFVYEVGRGWWNVIGFPAAGTGPYVEEGFQGELRSFYVSAPGKRSPVMEARSRPGFDVDAGLIELQDLPRIGGLVLDAGGRPVARAMVHVESADGRQVTAAITDEEGRFLVSEIAPGEWRIAVTHPEHARLETRRAMREGELDEVFRLGLPGSIGGRVSLAGRAPSAPERGADGRGEPLRLALIDAEAALPPSRSILRGGGHLVAPEQDGGFLFPGVTPGRYRVVGGLEGRLSWSEPVTVVAGERAAVDLDIAAGGGLGGRVLDGERPAAGLRLRLSRKPQELREGGDEIVGRCDDEGRYRFAGLPAGVWYLKFGKETMLSGTTLAERRVEIVDGVDLVRDVSLTSSRPLLRGRVLVGGKPRMKIALLVRPGRPLPVARATVDREGRFDLDGVADGDYYLWMTDDLYAPKVAHRIAVTLAADAPQQRDLELPAGTLGGVLIGADDAKVSVRPLLEDELGLDAAARFAVIEVAAREGRFEVGELVAGRYEVVVSAAGQAPVRTEVEVAGVTEIQVDLAARGGILELKVAELRGFGPEDRGGGMFDKLLIVRVLDEEGQEVGVLDESRYLRLEKGSTGRLALAAGRHRVLVQGKLAETLALDVELEAGATRTIEIRPRRAAEFRLRLAGEGLKPAALAGMKLAVTRPDGSRVEEVDLALAAGSQDQVALAEGVLRVLPLAAGTYRVQVEIPGFEPAEIEVSLATSEIKKGTLELERSD